MQYKIFKVGFLQHPSASSECFGRRMSALTRMVALEKGRAALTLENSTNCTSSRWFSRLKLRGSSTVVIHAKAQYAMSQSESGCMRFIAEVHSADAVHLHAEVADYP